MTGFFDEDFALVCEKPNFLVGKYPFRVYRSRFSPIGKPDEPATAWRYHFGFPKALVEPICRLLETSPYWGEAHWREHEGFWLWWLSVTGEADQPPPWEKLKGHLDFLLRAYNDCLALFHRR